MSINRKIKMVIEHLLPKFMIQKLIAYRHVKNYRINWINRDVTPDENPLLIYWNSGNNENRLRLIDLIMENIELMGDKDLVHILEYGSYVGINLKLITERVNCIRNPILYAIEPNKKAFEFMMEKLPFIKGLNKEDEGFVKNIDFPGHSIDISFSNAVFYSMEYHRVFNVCKKLAEISQIVIIGDELANFDGTKTKFMNIIDNEGTTHQSLCHPYKKMLTQFGFKNITVYPLEKPVHALAGFIVARK